MKRIFLLCLSLSVLLFCFPARLPAQQEYVIGEGDLLRITVYDHPDLLTEVRVGGDGRITFPLIGDVGVSDLRVSDAEKVVAGLLSDGYIVNPHVSIFVAEYKSKKVTVLGEVAKPGIVTLRGAYTLMETISDAGGLTQNAGDSIVITRKIVPASAERQLVQSLSEKGVGDGQEKQKDMVSSIAKALAGKSAKGETTEVDELNLIVDAKRLFEDGDVTANVPVYDGDSIYVPKAAFVYVNGEVRTPGAYKISKGLTVLKAVTLAGGFTPKSSEGRTKIIRKTVQGEVKMKAKMDDLVMPDDVLFVPESWF